MGRSNYSRKGFRIELYAFLVLGILVVIREILIFISKNHIIIYAGLLLAALGVILKIYVDKHNRNEEEQRELEELRAGRSINYLLNKFKEAPTAFEIYIAKIFNRLGYQTEVTKGTGNGGKDIIMYKGGMKYVVEVKLYSEHNKIGREKIQKLQGAMLDSTADKAIFVTTSRYTRESIEYGKKHDILLIDGISLVRLIDRVLGEGEWSSVNNETNPLLMFDKLFE